jgi:hypothetical protein
MYVLQLYYFDFFLLVKRRTIPVPKSIGPEIIPKNISGQCKTLNKKPIRMRKKPKTIREKDKSFI